MLQNNGVQFAGHLLALRITSNTMSRFELAGLQQSIKERVTSAVTKRFEILSILSSVESLTVHPLVATYKNVLCNCEVNLIYAISFLRFRSIISKKKGVGFTFNL
jgi:hypothetical protein